MRLLKLNGFRRLLKLNHVTDICTCLFFQKLSCCSTLGLFATSSEDQSVKIWNTDNQLVREMCFDESLCGVCFANSRGDILVGFQSHISLVTILNYLPLSYLKILSRKSIENDPFEDHVQFNDLLKSWYDPQRVPRMPLKADKRRPLELTEIKKPKKRKKVQVGWILYYKALYYFRRIFSYSIHKHFLRCKWLRQHVRFYWNF